MRTGILTVLLAAISVFNLLAQEEREFTVRKVTASVSTQKFFYETAELNNRTMQFDTDFAGYILKNKDTFQWIKSPVKGDTGINDPVPEYSFTFSLANDSVYVKYGPAYNANTTGFFYKRQSNTEGKVDFSYATLFAGKIQQKQTATLLDSAVNVTIDTTIYSCALVVLTIDTMMARDWIKLKGGRMGAGKRKEYIYTYCYLRNNDYLPVKIIETYSTPDDADKEAPAWLVNRFWILKYRSE